MDNALTPGKITSRKFVTVVFSLLSVALAVTSICIYCFNTYDSLMRLVFANDHFRVLAWVSLLVPFIISFIIRKAIDRISYPWLCVLFFVYTILIGICFSFILLDFVDSSLFGIFAASCLVFGFAAVISAKTQIGFACFKPILAMLAGGIIAVILMVIYLPDLQIELFTSCIGVVAIIGIAAFHFESLKELGSIQDSDEKSSKKLALFCALKLYIDYVNLVFFVIYLFIQKQDEEDDAKG